MAPDLAVSIRSLGKRFRLYRGRQIFTVKDLVVRGGRASLLGGEEMWALRDVSLDLPRGRMVGLIGSNGSGKSTLLKVIGGILKPSAGTVEVAGRVSALIELGAGFHPEFTGRENVFINGVLLGLSRAEIRERFADIVAFAGLAPYIDNPVKTYSSGMYARLGFAVYEKDVIKEALFQALGTGDRDWSRRLSTASFNVLLALAERAVAGQRSVIVEGNFRPEHAAVFERLRVQHGVQLVQILCGGSGRVLVERFENRVRRQARHAGHLDRLALPELRTDLER